MNGFGLNLLAQVANDPSGAETAKTFPTVEQMMDFERLWQKLDAISTVQAMGALTIAIIFIFYGWRLFRLLIALNFICIGLVLGQKAGEFSQQPNIVLFCGVLGAIFLGVMTYPFMKYCAAALGALAGSIIVGALWKGFMGANAEILPGVLAGLVAGGFLAFSSFRYTVMMFTSVQGSVMLLIGIMALLKRETPLADTMKQYLIDMPMNLPAILAVCVVFSILLQKRMLSTENNWSMPSDEGWKRN